MTQNNKVLLIGWDAADWKVITPLVDEGKMPNMKRFLQGGVMGNLATLYPVLSPMLWTSIATGKRAYKHGIHGFSEPDPNTGGIRPITNSSRTTKAIWNILNQNGKRSNVVGWWPSYPVETINGVMVSNHYQEAPPSLNQPWPVKPGHIHPPRLIEPLANLRIRPEEIEGEQLLAFVPNASEIDQEKDRRLFGVAKILAECASIHAAATAIMQLEPWDFMGVYYDAIDHFGHGFMKYHPPKSPWISDQDFELYKDVIEGCYRFHDLMLGVMMELAGDDTTIIICSDHGFHPDRLRPQFIPNEPAGPAEEHRPFGVVAMKGPGIKKDELIFGASLLDITPTILTIFGLPLGKDMDGKPLVTAFEETPQLEYIESWDDVEGDHAMLPPDLRVDAIDSQQAIQQLVDLGYIDEPGADQGEAVAHTVRELRYNLARCYFGANRYREGIPILEELWLDYPEEGRFGVKLFNSYLSLNEVENARATLDKIISNKEKFAQEAKEELQKLMTELKEKEGEEYTEQERRKIRKLQARAGVNTATFAFLKGSLLLAEQRYDDALFELTKAQNTQLHNKPSLYLKIGEVHLAKKSWSLAESHFLEVLELDPINPSAHFGLARCYLKQNRNHEAVNEATATIGLIHHNPQAHLLAGIALYRCNRIDDAVKMLETAIQQNPVFPAAHRYLSYLYNKDLHNPEAARKHRRLAKESRQRMRDFHEGKIGINETPVMVAEWLNKASQAPIKPATAALEDSIIIVSGLPRSGTSMMMQMLASGGLPVVTDNVRSADESNLKGYYEFEKTKQLAEDNRWVEELKGQGVKIVAQLLPKLPPNHHYRVIFMQRHLEEVIASQKKMLSRLGKKGGNLSETQLANTFVKQLNQVQQVLEYYDNISVLYLNYEDVVNNPTEAASKINQFCDGKLDTEAMVKAVLPTLRHETLTK